MLRAHDAGAALCLQRGDDQRRPAAQVGRFHVRSVQQVHAVDMQRPAANIHAGAQPQKAFGAGKTVFKNRVRHTAFPLRPQQRRRHQGCRVRWERWIHARIPPSRGAQSARACQRHRAVPRGRHHASGPAQDAQHLGQMGVAGIGEQHLAAAARHSAQHGGRGNAVRADGMLRAHQQLPAADVQHPRADACDIRARALQKARQIRHLRLHGRAAQHRLSSGCGRRHEKRLGGAHTGEAQADIRARKAVRRSDLQRAAVLLRDMRPHLLKAGKMHINGPRAQAAAAGRIDVRAARAGQQRRQIEQRGAHRAHQRLRHCAARKFRRRNDGAPILQQDLAAHALQDARRSLHVGQMRHVRERHRAAAQHRRRHDGQHTVLCAGYPHLSKKAAASADRQNFHIPHPVS